MATVGGYNSSHFCHNFEKYEANFVILFLFLLEMI